MNTVFLPVCSLSFSRDGSLSFLKGANFSLFGVSHSLLLCLDAMMLVQAGLRCACNSVLCFLMICYYLASAA